MILHLLTQLHRLVDKIPTPTICGHRNPLDRSTCQLSQDHTGPHRRLNTTWTNYAEN